MTLEALQNAYPGVTWEVSGDGRVVTGKPRNGGEIILRRTADGVASASFRHGPIRGFATAQSVSDAMSALCVRVPLFPKGWTTTAPVDRIAQANIEERKRRWSEGCAR